MTAQHAYKLNLDGTVDQDEILNRALLGDQSAAVRVREEMEFLRELRRAAKAVKKTKEALDDALTENKLRMSDAEMRELTAANRAADVAFRQLCWELRK